MAHSKFSLDGCAFEVSTRHVMQPDHVMPLQGEAGVDTQIFQTPPGSPAPQEEQGAQAADAPETSILKCIMEDACDDLHAFQECERYFFGPNPGSDCDVPEDEFTDEMESDEDQLVPVNLQEEEGPTDGYHGQHSPGNIPVDDSTAVEENVEPSVVNLHVTLVNVQGTEPEDIVAIEEDQLVPVNLQEVEHFTEGGHDRSSPVVISMEGVRSDEDELIPVNLQEEEDPNFQGDYDLTSHPGNIPLEDITAIDEDENLQEEENPAFQGDHDQLSSGSIPLEDITAIEEDQLDPVNFQEEDYPTEWEHDLPSLVIIPVENLSSEEDHLIPVNLQVKEDPTEGDRDQPSRPGNIPVEDIISIEGNETSPVNLHVTLANVQVTEPEDPNTPGHLDFNIETFDSFYPEVDQEVIPEIQLDVAVLRVTKTSTAGGESSSSSRILMDIHVDPKPPESEDSYELHEAVNGNSIDLKDVNETPLKRAIEAGAPET